MTVDKEDINPVIESSGDKFYRLARAALGLLPVGSGTAVELFNALITPPLEQRRNKWMVDVTESLQRLESQKNINLSEVFENEEFISLLLSISQVAIRNHNREKISALKNIVLNKASGINVDENLEATFINLIDQYSPLHIKLIKIIHEGFVWSNEGYPKPEDKEVPGMLVANIGSYKDLQRVDRLLIRNCLMDFVRVDLIHYWIVRDITNEFPNGSFSCELEQWESRSRSELVVNHGPAMKADQKPGRYVVATSNFGNKFISFISKPV